MSAGVGKIVVVRGIVAWLMRTIGMAGVTMPWRTIYLLPEFKDKQDLIAHERVHVAQMTLDGPVWFSVRYLWWLARYGYWNNPYEIEAYEMAPVDWTGIELVKK